VNGVKKSLLFLVICLVGLGACEVDEGLRLPSREGGVSDTGGYELVARIVHISDTHITDEESPARFAGAGEIVSSAWRPYEAYSTQLFDGIIRTVNRIHASGRTVDFVVLTGDACDNSQGNELAWCLDVLDGQVINPLSGPDDRPVEDRPDPSMDPHATFDAQGLYQTGVHGDLPSIPWFAVPGNHDAFAIGVFAIIEDFWGRRTAPLPLPRRPGLFLPVVLDPLAWLAHGNVTPAEPGPPCLFEIPRFVPPNPERTFFNRREFIRAMFTTETEPAGHGFVDPETDPGWYSVAPVPGLRLIGLDTSRPAHELPGSFFYQDGSISAEQVAFLRGELEAAGERGELVVVASHHPSRSLWPGYGSALAGSGFRELLNEYPNVVVHLAGHSHRNRITDRDAYLEVETCSTLDLPQEGRLLEIWRNQADGTALLSYEMFSHLDDELPPLGDDPLEAQRRLAQATALGDAGAADRQKRGDPTGADPYGRPSDRRGSVVLVAGP
jgi:3',5'-cyclic AMP phosphodiesterase CpdA